MVFCRPRSQRSPARACPRSCCRTLRLGLRFRPWTAQASCARRLFCLEAAEVMSVVCGVVGLHPAAVAYLLRTVDVGAQAPTQFPIKMTARPSCAARCAKIQKIRAAFLLSSSFSQLAHESHVCFDKLRFIGRGKKALAQPSPLPLSSAAEQQSAPPCA